VVVVVVGGRVVVVVVGGSVVVVVVGGRVVVVVVVLDVVVVVVPQSGASSSQWSSPSMKEIDALNALPGVTPPGETSRKREAIAAAVASAAPVEARVRRGGRRRSRPRTPALAVRNAKTPQMSRLTGLSPPPNGTRRSCSVSGPSVRFRSPDG
jgi:hypothetical protein